MPKKYTNEEFLDLVKEIRPDVTPLEQYINAETSINFKCNNCGYIFRNSPSRVLGSRKQGCPKCYADSKRTSNDEFLNKAKSNKNVSIVGRYRGIKNKIDVECTYCGEIISMRADSILEGRGHGSCIQKRIKREPKRTQEQFIKDLENANKNVEALGTYTKTNEKMLFRCKICGNEWRSLVKHILYQDSGCPKCNQSKGERKISDYLQNNKIDFIPQHTFDDCKDTLCLPFDFYIPSMNVCIEYDGEQHFREVEFFRNSLEYIQHHDEIKNNYCKNNNITLIRIPYTEFNNVETIIDEFIKNRQLSYCREIGKTGKDPDCTVAEFINRTVNEELYNTPDELLDQIFDRGYVGEFDDVEGHKTPKNTLVAHEAAKGGTVDRSYIDVTPLKPTWKNRQIESDISYVDLRKGGFKAIATLTTFMKEAAQNALFYDALSMADMAVTGGEQLIAVSGTTPTLEAMDALSLYLNDRGDNNVIVTLNKYAQAIRRMPNFAQYLSTDMKNDFNRYGLVKTYDGINVAGISGARKTGLGTLLLPDKRIYGIANKIGTLDMKGESHTYQDMNNQSEKIHIMFKDFNYGIMLTNIENFAKVTLQ